MEDEKGGADFSKLLLLAECACDVAAQAQQSWALSCKKPPFFHLPPPQIAYISSGRRLRALPPASCQSAAAKFMGLVGNAPHCSSAIALPSPPQEDKPCCDGVPPALSSLPFSLPPPQIPPVSLQPFKKPCGDENPPSSSFTFSIPAPEIPPSSFSGPGLRMRRKPAPSSLPYRKLRRNHLPPRGWLDACLRLKGTMPVWFGRKLLTATDVGAHFNRLSLPKEAVGGMMASAWMTDAEKLDARMSDRGLPVAVLDRMGRTWKLVLKYWRSSKAQVLHGEWKDLVEENHLRANIDWIDFWALRANGPNGPLWLAVI